MNKNCQVSLMSGLNVWLKLLKSPSLLPRPFLLSPDAVVAEGSSSSMAELEKIAVYQLPYAAALRHTVEEVVDYCENCLSSARHAADSISGKISHNCKSSGSTFSYRFPLRHAPKFIRFFKMNIVSIANGLDFHLPGEILQELDLDESMRSSHALANPRAEKLCLKTFCEMARECGAIVFIALHGGVGEDGKIQAYFDGSSVRLPCTL